jgi:hypothetical protein
MPNKLIMLGDFDLSLLVEASKVLFPAQQRGYRNNGLVAITSAKDVLIRVFVEISNQFTIQQHSFAIDHGWYCIDWSNHQTSSHDNQQVCFCQITSKRGMKTLRQAFSKEHDIWLDVASTFLFVALGSVIRLQNDAFTFFAIHRFPTFDAASCSEVAVTFEYLISRNVSKELQAINVLCIISQQLLRFAQDLQK